MNSQTTRGVIVTAMPQYLADQSDPAQFRYVWAYHIIIHNEGAATVQLLTRYWHITDARGKVEEVRGPGVIGEQPVLRTGEAFRYSSGVHLGTPSGFMKGTYQMKLDTGEMFDAVVPTFSLDTPFGNGRPN